jgi:hypothetical protein
VTGIEDHFEILAQLSGPQNPPSAEISNRGRARSFEHPGRIGAAHQRRSEMDHEPVDEISGVERGCDASSTFDENLQHALVAQVVEKIIEGAMPFPAWLDSRIRWGSAQDDAERIGTLDQPGREFRIIGANGSRSYDDRVTVGSKPVNLAASFGSGDPLARPIGRRSGTVEGGGEFGDHEGSTGAAVMKIGPQRVLGLGGANPRDHIDTVGAKAGDPSSGHV